MQTDLPDPVVPAINKWGIEAKSPTTGMPEIFLPSAIGNLISFLLKVKALDLTLLRTVPFFEFVLSIRLDSLKI